MPAIIFEKLIEGRKGYAPELVDLKPVYKEACKQLVKHVKKVLRKIQHKRRPIEMFKIAKTSARKNKNKFDKMDFDTWRRTNIENHWKKYKKEGYDGMIVLCAVTHKMLSKHGQPKAGPHYLYKTEAYTIALKQHLIHHFVFDNQDERLENKSLQAGGASRTGSVPGVVYIVFKLAPRKCGKGKYSQ